MADCRQPIRARPIAMLVPAAETTDARQEVFCCTSSSSATWRICLAHICPASRSRSGYDRLGTLAGVGFQPVPSPEAVLDRCSAGCLAIGFLGRLFLRRGSDTTLPTAQQNCLATNIPAEPDTALALALFDDCPFMQAPARHCGHDADNYRAIF
jgi:hypothetical protein